jgi:hypothetical protein
MVLRPLDGDRVSGVYRRVIVTASSRFAMLEVFGTVAQTFNCQRIV